MPEQVRYEAFERQSAGVGSGEDRPLPARVFVETLASRKIRGFLGTIDSDGTYLTEMAKSLTAQTTNVATDYRDRFLIELIQNAYDAQPDGARDGRITVLLDYSAGDHGALYIANTGQPFRQENVKALSDIALSGKSVGQSIGNKGLGFRSVLQITDNPKVFSQDVDSGARDRFQGYCFRFATQRDFDALIENSTHRELAKKHLPKFNIPIWLEDQDRVICDFARQGMSTVIVLPFRNASAAEATRRRVDELEAQVVPMHLFLERLKELQVRVVSKEGNLENCFSFTRSEIEHRAADLTFSRVSLGESGQYLVARRTVAEDTMKATIAKAVEFNELDTYWNDWSGPGDVALAVRLDAPQEVSRIYTYLPMGDQAEAPFPGFLQGSFFPSSNRKSLDAEHLLNALILEHARELVADSLWLLVGMTGTDLSIPLSDSEAATVVAALMSWRSVSSLKTDKDLCEAMAAALVARFGCEKLDLAAIVPCVEMSLGTPRLVWKQSEHARRWPLGLSVFGDEVAAENAWDMRLWPVWPLSEDLTASLSDFLSQGCESFRESPSGKERARLVEIVATSLSATSPKSKSKWIDYFTELPVLMEASAKSLAGLQVLVGEGGTLCRAMSHAQDTEPGNRYSRRRRRKEIAVFSPPDQSRLAEGVDVELEPPAKLRARFGFLWGALGWHDDLSEARQFLEDHGLVEAFDREAIFRRLDQMLRDEGNKEVLRGGLRWAFELWRQARSSPRPFQMQSVFRFRVPVQNGDYVNAKDVVFSSSWPDETLGSLVEDFLDAAPDALAEVAGLRQQLLADTEHQAFRDRHIDDWMVFLSELGVRRGLHPIEKSPRKSFFKADEIRDFSFVEQYGITREFGQFWHSYVMGEDEDALDLQYATNYRIAGNLLWFPCQGDFQVFGPTCLLNYAKLVLKWLEGRPSFSPHVEVHHQYNRNVDRRQWPMPLTAFLRAAPWVPMDEGRASDNTQASMTASDIWLGDIDKELFLPFLPRPKIEIRRLIERGGVQFLQSLGTRAGFNQIGNDATLADQLAMLSECLVAGAFDPFYRQRLLNLYSASWRRFLEYIVETGGSADDTRRPTEVLVQRGQQIVAVDLYDQDDVDQNGPVYLCDTGRRGDVDLLMTSGKLFIHLAGLDDDAVWDVFEGLYPERVRRVSKVAYKLQVDGHEISDVTGAPIRDLVPELRTMVAVAMEAMKGTEAQRLPSNRAEVLRHLDQIVLAQVDKVHFVIDGFSVAIEHLDRRSFGFTLDDGRTLILLRATGALDWNLVDGCIHQICEALGYVSLVSHLRLLVSKHSAHRFGASEEAIQDQVSAMAATLLLSQDETRAALASLSEGLETRVPLMRAVIYYAAGSDAVQEFDGQIKALGKEPGGLRTLWKDALKNTTFGPGVLEEAIRDGYTAQDFRTILGLDFKRFNASLRAVGEEMELYPEQHRRAMDAFVREHDLGITQCILLSAQDTLEAFEAFEGYGDLRASVYEIEPDRTWLENFEVPPEDLLKDRVNAWLEGHEAPLLGHPESTPNELMDIRAHNRRCFESFFQKAMPILRAWCIKKGAFGAAEHFTRAKASDELRAWMDRVGVLDFQALDDEMLVRWCIALGAWPEGMEPTLNTDELKLSDDDLKQEAIEARKRREARKRDARSVAFNGRMIDPEESVDFEALVTEIAETLPRSEISRSLGSQAALAVVPNDDRPKSGTEKSPKEPTQSHSVRIPAEKTEFIGRIGEIVVYTWLKNILKGQDIDAAWKSENGKFIIGGNGNDGLGYDFEVSFNKQTWRIEVKASLNDPRNFELGETEVRAAREAAKARSGVQYKIAYVSNVSSPTETRIEMLPNPLSDEGASCLDLLGEGIRYGFKRL